MEQDIKDRRPIKARQTRWASYFARVLQLRGFTPNAISLFSILFALIAGISFIFAFRTEQDSTTRLLLLVGAIGIQGRLLCNLLDGMVAVEGKLRSPVGAIYNDLPDRISDTLIIMGVGYGITVWPFAPTLAWAATVMAVLTAYIRLLGGSCGLSQQFSGPMAKQHRMAILTLASLLALIVPAYGQWIFIAALGVILLGSAVTCINRTRQIMNTLRIQG
ncbi:CDP-alcohol phosphatidyltransferase family protein [Pectobacterium polaris]|uniref:CDP-alcohol phosphatidyltransferase family protein n=1 Tax=Pectobacterium polaris TaxID=2042057 RepID=UPI00240505A1|nr:CDP-alcohol phosphatidyltransferase family protein [Pectobacterium polaris]MDG0803705.1 CDP-alcohol phosphatidyltransferase family protein [Pectobacterium polaris]